MKNAEHKSFRVEAKEDAEPGTFEGYASVWSNVDSYGDVMVRGAFADSISSRGLPAISYEHNWDAPPIGVVTDATEDEFGLRVKGRLFIEHPDVRSIYEAMKAGGLTEMSFAFLTKDAEDGTHKGEKVRFVKSVDWLEAAVVWKGANDAAKLVSVRKHPLEDDPDADERLAADLDAIAARAKEEALAAAERDRLLRSIDINLATAEPWETEDG